MMCSWKKKKIPAPFEKPDQLTKNNVTVGGLKSLSADQQMNPCKSNVVVQSRLNWFAVQW